MYVKLKVRRTEYGYRRIDLLGVPYSLEYSSYIQEYYALLQIKLLL